MTCSLGVDQTISSLSLVVVLFFYALTMSKSSQSPDQKVGLFPLVEQQERRPDRQWGLAVVCYKRDILWIEAACLNKA